MPFGRSFDQLLDKAKSRVDAFTNQHLGQPPPIPSASKPPPPAVPSGSKPPPSYTPPHASRAYWRAVFDPSSLVSVNFKHQTGQHGWGNNESQNYTSDPQNSFHTPNHQLVLRGIVNSSAPTQETKYTSARLTSHHTLGRQKGCLTAVLSPPCAPGIWPAFWLLPREPFAWPNDGEVDIFESWNADMINRSCLHWGHFNGEDWDKHRVVETHIPDMSHRPITVGLAWEQPESGQGGRLIWYIDGRAVMKAEIPRGTRKIDDWQVIINVAMGGNVCGGRLPADGCYDFVVHELRMDEEPANGWHGFDADWRKTREGKKG